MARLVIPCDTDKVLWGPWERALTPPQNQRRFLQGDTVWSAILTLGVYRMKEELEEEGAGKEKDEEEEEGGWETWKNRE